MVKDDKNEILHPKGVDSLWFKGSGEGVKDKNAHYIGIYVRA